MDLGGEPAETSGPSTSMAGQLPGGQAEQRPGAERAQRQLDPRLVTLVGDQRGRGMQAAGQRQVRRRRLRRVGMRG